MFRPNFSQNWRPPTVAQVRLLHLLPRGAIVGGYLSLALAMANLLALAYLCFRSSSVVYCSGISYRRERKQGGPEGTVEMEVDMRSKTLKATAPITRL